MIATLPGLSCRAAADVSATLARAEEALSLARRIRRAMGETPGCLWRRNHG